MNENNVRINTKKFKTRTMNISRSNGSIRGAFPIAIDCGFSGVKVFSQNTVAVFPSFAKRLTDELIGELPDTHIIYRDLDTGEEWLVGESAQNDVMQDDVTISDKAVSDRERYNEPMFRVLVRTGLGIGCRKNEYGDPAGKTIYVQTGLPVKYLQRDAPKLIPIIAGHHRFALRIGNRPETVFDMTIQKNNVYVMEQPKGTLYSIAKDNSHRFIKEAGDYFRKNLIIFDGGYGTLDIFSIRNNVVVGKETFPKFSMKEVLKRTIKKIYDTYETEVSLVGMQKCLGDGYIKCYDMFSSRNQDFAEILDAANREVCDEALEELGHNLPLYDYNYIVVTGGTGAAWNEMIREKLKGLDGLTVINGNQNDTSLPFLFANVRGYYMFLYDRVSVLVSNSR